MNPRVAVWVVNGLLAGLAAVSIFPLLWMVSVSLMPAGASSTLPTPLIPSRLTLDNYRLLFGNIGMGRYVLNSLGLAVLATLISVSFNVMAGYAFVLCDKDGVTYSGLLGYRLLDVDYEQGSGRTRYEYDVLQHGPLSGLTINF